MRPPTFTDPRIEDSWRCVQESISVLYSMARREGRVIYPGYAGPAIFGLLAHQVKDANVLSITD